MYAYISTTSRVPFETLISLITVTKFSVLYGNTQLFTVFTEACCWMAVSVTLKLTEALCGAVLVTSVSNTFICSQ
jgi:hypothetical protein